MGRLDGGGVWVAQWTDVNLRTADQVRTWRAISAAAQGGAVPVIVPSCDKKFFPVPLVDGHPLYSYGAIPHSDGSFFSDGSGYSQPVVVCESVGDAVLRSTSLILHFTAGSALRGGEVFAIEHPTQNWHRYVIKTVTLNGDGDSVVTFEPPLREAVPGGTDIEFDLPRCVMRLASGGAMDLELDLRRFGSPSAAFVEYFYPVS